MTNDADAKELETIHAAMTAYNDALDELRAAIAQYNNDSNSANLQTVRNLNRRAATIFRERLFDDGGGDYITDKRHLHHICHQEGCAIPAA